MLEPHLDLHWNHSMWIHNTSLRCYLHIKSIQFFFVIKLWPQNNIPDRSRTEKFRIRHYPTGSLHFSVSVRKNWSQHEKRASSLSDERKLTQVRELLKKKQKITTNSYEPDTTLHLFLALSYTLSFLTTIWTWPLRKKEVYFKALELTHKTSSIALLNLADSLTNVGSNRMIGCLKKKLIFPLFLF
jgi:hypothetical protein